MVIERFKTGRRPYRILFHPDGKSFFVTSWTDGTLGSYQADNGALLATVRLASHPTDIVWRPGALEPVEGETPLAGRLFVSAANTNNVFSIGLTQSKELRLLESINVAMTPRHPLGMTPSALALSPDLKQLYVVCSDANAVAVADVSLDRAEVRGLHPHGLVSDRRARARRWQAGDPERPRRAVVPEPRRPRSNQKGRAAA